MTDTRDGAVTAASGSDRLVAALRTAMGSPGSLRREAFNAFIVKGVGAAAAFTLNATIGRKLGTDRAGIYFLALTICTVAMTVSRLGLDSIVLREAAGADPVGRRHFLSRLYATAIPTIATAALLIAAVTWIASPTLAPLAFHSTQLIEPLRWAAAAILPLSLVQIHGELLRGIRRIVSSQVVQTVLVPGSALAILWLIPGASNSPARVMGTYAIAAGSTAIVAMGLWRKALAAHDPAPSTVARTRTELLRAGRPLLSADVMTLIVTWSGTLVLGALASSSDVALYNAASRSVLVVSLMLASVNAIAAPVFAEQHARRQYRALERTAQRATMLLAAAALPILGAFVVFARPVIMLFGADFSSGADLLRVLVIGQFINVATGSVTYLLTMTGNERTVRNIMIATVTINLVSMVLLTKLYGAIGAAWASALTLSFQNLTAMLAVRRRLGFWTISLPSRAATGT